MLQRSAGWNRATSGGIVTILVIFLAVVLFILIANMVAMGDGR